MRQMTAAMASGRLSDPPYNVEPARAIFCDLFQWPFLAIVGV